MQLNERHFAMQMSLILVTKPPDDPHTAYLTDFVPRFNFLIELGDLSETNSPRYRNLDSTGRFIVPKIVRFIVYVESSGL